MIHRTRQGIGTWLALFAMLMIYVGPLVSQSLPMDHPMPMQHGPSMQHEGMAAHDMAGMAHANGHRAAGHGATLASHGGKSLSADAFMEKCGYCSLLIHSPPLTPPPVLLDHGQIAVGAPVVQFTSGTIPASPVFPGARSRAPPTLIG